MPVHLRVPFNETVKIVNAIKSLTLNTDILNILCDKRCIHKARILQNQV